MNTLISPNAEYIARDGDGWYAAYSEKPVWEGDEWGPLHYISVCSDRKFHELYEARLPATKGGIRKIRTDKEGVRYIVVANQKVKL